MAFLVSSFRPEGYIIGAQIAPAEGFDYVCFDARIVFTFDFCYRDLVLKKVNNNKVGVSLQPALFNAVRYDSDIECWIFCF